MSLPTDENTVEDLSANHQNTKEIRMMGTPNTTASVSSIAAVPPITGTMSNRQGSPQVVNEGTTAVTMIDEAMV
jgi:hypothetical protein